jgi:hypothetical protein
LWLFYVYDVISVVYFGAKPHLNVSDLTVPLPGETNLWEARTHMEWFWILAGDSKYGHFHDPLAGSSVFAVLSTMRLHTTTPSLYSSWQLTSSISVILLEIHRALVDRREAKMEFFQYYDYSRGVPTKIRFLGEHIDFSEMYLMLQKWFDAWLRCPDVFDSNGHRRMHEVCFYDLIYIYYTAHILLLTFEKPSDEFAWDGCAMALAAKLWLQRRFPRGDRNTAVSWEALSNMRYSNPNGDIPTLFSNIYNRSSVKPLAGLAIYC